MTAALVPSCAELKNISTEVFEGSTPIADAVVYRVGAVTYQESLGSSLSGAGIGNEKKRYKVGNNVDKYTGSQGSYSQKIWVRGGGYDVCGTRSCDSYNDYLSSGQTGILYVGKKTGKFKSFEPTY